jgi:hypothetical protein
MLAAMSFGGGMGVGCGIGMDRVDCAGYGLDVFFGRCSRFLGVGLRYHQVRSR